MLAGCGGGCPEVQRIDASSDTPAFVRVLFSVQCRDEPVTDLSSADITLFEGGEQVVGSEATWELEPHSATLETYSLLLIDVSDSIIDSGTLEVAREVAIEFATALTGSNQQVSVAIFDGHEEIRTVISFSADASELSDAIEGISAADQLDESTNLNGAVLQGLAILDEAVVPDVEAELLSVANLVIFTDGVDRAGRESDSAAKNAVSGSDHQVFVVGLAVTGEAADTLAELGKDGYFAADDPEDLFTTFDAVTERLVDEVNKYYRLTYCSPLREPRATLRIEVAWDDRTSSIKYSYPTKDFGAGCQL